MPSDRDPHRNRRRAIFVYYTLRAEQVPQLKLAFARAASLPGPWQAELLRRAPGTSGGLQTWMEIYWLREESRLEAGAGPGAGCDWDHEAIRQIESRARSAGIVELIDGERHYEAFESCA
jgi:hypothetical protein